MIATDCGSGVFARLPAFVVSRRSQFVFNDRIQQNQFITDRMEREIFIFERTAIQADQTTFFSEYGGELVHNTAVYTTIVMFRRLADLSQFEFINVQGEQVV